VRNLEEMMAERGIDVDHSTVHRWAIKLLPILEQGIPLPRRTLTYRRSWPNSNFQGYFDESDSLISPGPFFGSDAADECMRSLEAPGLAYVDDLLSSRTLFPTSVCSKYLT
jgi:hypothetical protein